MFEALTCGPRSWRTRVRPDLPTTRGRSRTQWSRPRKMSASSRFENRNAMRHLLTIATLLIVALSMGMALAHALELPPKMGYDASMYLRLHRTLYLLFGPPLGASIEALAVALSIVLAFIVRHEPR